MARRDAERLRNYLMMISRSRGGLDQVIEATSTMERPAMPGSASLESIGPGEDPVEVARQGLESLALENAPSDAQHDCLEAIILPDLRPAIDIVDGTFTVTHHLWTQLSDDPAIRQRIEAVIPSVGRIELEGLPNCPYAGTGFVVGDGLIMTNRHVAELFASGLGDRSFRFLDGRVAGIDFRREYNRPTGPALKVREVAMIHPYWDMAILRVDGLPAKSKSLRLSLNDARDFANRQIFVIGYPAFDGRNPKEVQQEVFSGHYGIKRLQPGELQGGVSTASFGKVVPAATHDCSTLGGNSGSAVVDLQTGEVLALHFGGRYQEKNFAVPCAELARDQRVVDTGVQFAGTAAGGTPPWADWWRRADGVETASPAATSPAATSPATVPAATPAAAGAAQPPGGGDGGIRQSTTQPAPASPLAVTSGDGAIHIELPLRITISLGAPVAVPTVAAAAAPVESVAGDVAAEEAPRRQRDTDYASRRGYDPDFLNAPGQPGGETLPVVQVPMPTAADPAVCARTIAGGTTLDYQNFSIIMHAARRLALITAANVTAETALRQPEGRPYTRQELGGGSDSWHPDPRLDRQFQLPDVFFTRDRGAFDRGHVVRRDDVAWGPSLDLLRRANDDSFHGTNCSPQVATFNQSARGRDNWGDLENHVLADAANERLCVLAGPVLAASDEVFVGVGEGGVPLRAKIPTRFWKVIVAKVLDGIAAYGFVLEQDLSDVDLEFSVPPEFAPKMYPISEIETMSSVVFDASIRDADQYDTVRGGEVGLRAGVPLRRPR